MRLLIILWWCIAGGESRTREARCPLNVRTGRWEYMCLMRWLMFNRVKVAIYQCNTMASPPLTVRPLSSYHIIQLSVFLGNQAQFALSIQNVAKLGTYQSTTCPTPARIQSTRGKRYRTRTLPCSNKLPNAFLDTIRFRWLKFLPKKFCGLGKTSVNPPFTRSR